MNNIKDWKPQDLSGGACNAIQGGYVVSTFESRSEFDEVVNKANGMGSVSFEWYAIPPYKDGEKWSILNEKGEFVASFTFKAQCLDVIKLVSM